MKPKVREAYISGETPAQVFSTIEKALSESLNTQIFVDNTLYHELNTNGPKHSVFSINTITESNSHYNSHHSEGCYYTNVKTFCLTAGNYFDNKVACISFVNNSKDYMQVVEFSSKKIKNYTHYCVGINTLLFIHLI